MDSGVRLQPGMLFAKEFRVIRPLAEGGMGAVYVVEQLSTGNQRALKVMHPQVVTDPRNREKFAQEARVGAQIRSAHVVEVAAAGIDEATGTPWLAMELLEGSDLAGVMKSRGPLGWAEAAEIFEQLGDALGKAHAAGVVHRDLKPENIFISTSRLRGVPFVVKVLDFGIAKVVAEHKTAATVTSAIGSPLWMAPEQTNRGARIRPSTDVWALGLIAFHLLTGRYYWPSANAPDDEFNLSGLLVDIMVQPLDPPSVRAGSMGVASRLPPGFDGWFGRCVTRDPEARFQNAGEAVQALSPMFSSQAPPAPSQLPSPSTSLAFGPTLLPNPSSTVAWNPTVALPSAPQPGGLPSAVGPRRLPVPALVAAGVLAVSLVGAAALYRPRPLDPSGADTQPASTALSEQTVRREAPITVDAGPQSGPNTEAAERAAAAQRAAAGAAAAAASARAASAAPPRSTPTVRAAPPSVTGLLSPEAIRRVVLRNLGQVNHCYEQGLATDPNLAGRVVVRFVIGGMGNVMASSLADNSLPTRSVGECVASAVRRWQFPSPEGGGVVTVNYPFNLTLSDDNGRARAPTPPRTRTQRSDPDLGDLGL